MNGESCDMAFDSARFHFLKVKARIGPSFARAIQNCVEARLSRVHDEF